MTLQQMALVAAAAALVVGPQILEAARKLTAGRGLPGSAGGSFNRSTAVAELLRLQGEMTAAGLDTAADLTGRLLVELVTNGKAPPAAGGKK